MNFKIIAFIIYLSFTSFLQGKNVLSDLNFESGKWEMVGVSLHNYIMLPIQNEFSSFVMKDLETLKEMKATWNFPNMYDDYCEYHYALKFYQNGILKKTLKVNLFCKYISEGGLSYKFDPQIFQIFKDKMQRLYISNIAFKDIKRIRAAIQKFSNQKDVYLYDDVEPFKYDGFFLIGVNNLPWNTNRDSLYNVVNKEVEKTLGTGNYYLKQYVFFVEKNIQDIRYEVFCNENTSKLYNSEKVLANWRTHFEDNDEINVVIVGINKKQYFDEMGK